MALSACPAGAARMSAIQAMPAAPRSLSHFIRRKTVKIER